MGNCILCFKEKPNVYFDPLTHDNQIYKSPDSTFKTSFGTIPSIVPPSPFCSPKDY
ncbi:uncharacterized protein METZ01_LOCUS43890 [marine metagenome]|jgi:hypothetical protein|uniref:Uncharacterized protein n=1 Tax=marine metagenome TaxID=408172 RepID=A0A381RGV0_9ZZZZ|tara:strand:- start:366 stop:533 length:168 start_codon:yes stop_codon:yes gene_type:complete